MKAKSDIPHENDRLRFSGAYKNLRVFIELLPSGGWFAGVYDLKVAAWLWTEYVSDPAEGKGLISQTQGINADEILCYEYQPLPTTETDIR